MDELLRITSRDNAKIKRAKSVREGSDPDLIFIEGFRLSEEALRSLVGIRTAFISDAARASARGTEIVDRLLASGVDTNSVPDQLAATLSDTRTGQGIVLLADRPADWTIDDLNAGDSSLPLIVFLEKINNPANLGAVIRTAEAAGAAGVILSANSADPHSPKALRASMGSAFRLKILQNTNLTDVLEWAGRAGLISTAADISATMPHTSMDWRTPRLLVMGSEAHGLHADLLAKVDELTRVEMENGVESLNLAVACGIILFEAKRQSAADR